MNQPFFDGVQRTGSELKHCNNRIIPLHAADLLWSLSLPQGADRSHEYCDPLAGGGPREEEIRRLPVILVRGGSFCGQAEGGGLDDGGAWWRSSSTADTMVWRLSIRNLPRLCTMISQISWPLLAWTIMVLKNVVLELLELTIYFVLLYIELYCRVSPTVLYFVIKNL